MKAESDGESGLSTQSAADSVSPAQSLDRVADSAVFRKMVETANEGIWLIDPAGRTTYANGRMAELLGYSVEEMAGRPHTDFMFEGDRPSGDVELQLRHEGSRKQWDQRYRHKSGRELWTIACCSPIYNEAGKFCGALGMFMDITARREAERALGDAEALFRGTFENAAVGIGHLSPKGQWLRVNETLCHFLGYDREELLQATFQQITHPDDLAADLHHVGRVLAGEIQNYTMEKRYRRKDGTYVWGHLTVALLRKTDGAPFQFIAVVQDISARRAAEEKLLQQRNAYQRLAENSPDVIARFDREGRHLYVNEAVTAASGLPPEMFIGRTNRELGMPPHLCQQWERALNEVFETGKGVTLAFDFERQGETLHLESICVPEFDDGGRIETVLSIARDVTPLRRAIADAQRGEERMNLALAAAALGVFEWNFLRGEVRWENQRLFEIFWKTDDRNPLGAGDRLVRLLHPEDREAFLTALRGAGAATGVWHHACRICRETDRAIRDVEFSARLERGADGQLLRLFGVVADVTERCEAERALRRSEERLLAAAQAKDTFLATLSHELRTPLNPVLLIASAAADNVSLPEEVRLDFQSIAKNALQQARLIDDLLDLTRVSQGKISLRKSRVDLKVILVDAVANLRGDALAKRQTVEVDIDTLDHAVLGDAGRLLQVFCNVLKNAIKFTPEGGRIFLQMRCSPLDDAVDVRCTDSGMGMTAAEIERIFDAFAQGEHAAGGGSHLHGGLGLGLAIARMLLGLHGGSIKATSAGREKGSTFTIRLPLAPACEEPANPELKDNPPGPQARVPLHRILLVEDHDPTRATLERLLSRRGYSVTSVATAQAAQNAAIHKTFDLVISDLGLPDGDGGELMELLRKRHGLRGVALTGYGMAEDIARTRAMGFVAHLTKPVSIGELDAILEGLSSR